MNIATTAAADNCELQAPAKAAAAADENKAQLALLGGQTAERESKEHQGSLVPARKEREKKRDNQSDKLANERKGRSVGRRSITTTSALHHRHHHHYLQLKPQSKVVDLIEH